MFVLGYNRVFNTKKTLEKLDKWDSKIKIPAPPLMSKKTQEFYAKVTGFFAMVLAILSILILILYLLGVLAIR